MQRFSVTIPLGMASPHATIQVKQWSDEFQWYYYACTDIQIVANQSTAGSGACWDRSASCTQFDGGPKKLRMSILESLAYILWVGLTFIALGLWAVVVCKCGSVQRAQATDMEQPPQIYKMEHKQSPQEHSCTSRFKAGASEFKRSLIAITILSIIAVIVIVTVLENLKTCSIDLSFNYI